ncbi:hypothetical protein ASZ78_008317, partial [Callipepla squamata]
PQVDRSVTGLVAQQQCVGPLHTPLADVAVVALSHLGLLGAATAVGEQPLKGLLNPEAGARLALCEALTNLCFARVTDIRVDRSVTGLVAQQQCVGPLHTPLADVAVVALSHLGLLGAATAVGEQPLKGLLNPEAGARLALCEALTNLCFARVTDIRVSAAPPPRKTPYKPI